MQPADIEFRLGCSRPFLEPESPSIGLVNYYVTAQAISVVLLLWTRMAFQGFPFFLFLFQEKLGRSLKSWRCTWKGHPTCRNALKKLIMTLYIRSFVNSQLIIISSSTLNLMNLHHLLVAFVYFGTVVVFYVSTKSVFCSV